MQSFAGDGYSIDIHMGGYNYAQLNQFFMTGVVLVEWGEISIPLPDGTSMELQGGQAAEFDGQWQLRGWGRVAVAHGPVERWDTRKITRSTVVRHEKPWGHELDVVTARKEFLLKHLVVENGQSTSLQRHEKKDEVMFFFDTRKFQHVAAGVEHVVKGYRSYFEASTYHPDDVVRISDDYGRSV